MVGTSARRAHGEGDKVKMNNTMAQNIASEAAATPPQQDESVQENIILAMSRIDPFLRFLTKATGKTSVPLKLLCQVLPKSKLSATYSTHSEHGEKNNDGGERGDDHFHLHEMLLELSYRGVLSYDIEKKAIGFPLPPSPSNSNDSRAPQPTITHVHSAVLKNAPSKLVGKGLHGSSETSAKRRMKVLKWSLNLVPSWICRNIETDPAKPQSEGGLDSRGGSSSINTRGTPMKEKVDPECSHVEEEEMDQLKPAHQDPIVDVDERFDGDIERRAAYQALDALLSGSGSTFTNKKGNADSDDSVDEKPTAKQWLPCQAAYAGSHSGRHVRYGALSKETAAKIPPECLQLFDLDLYGSDSATSNDLERPRRRLFLHQALAIESAMHNYHTVVQTATGSGKSFCFLLPVLAKAMRSLEQRERPSSGTAAILLFPTKALANDQFSKIVTLLRPLENSDSDSTPLRAGVIDGDTPHSKRDEIATQCQIILTNPDTLHAAILPNWKKNHAYQSLLARISTVVIDEAHVYEGAFGAHVAMVLRRLLRVCRVASSPSNTGNATSTTSIAFIACSATMMHPEGHFRLLCPIGKEEKVCVLTSKDDGSPCPPKHFFVWNPPILDVNGISSESVFLPKRATSEKNRIAAGTEVEDICKSGDGSFNNALVDNSVMNIPISKRKSKRKRLFNLSEEHTQPSSLFTQRRHAADETAFLLAKAITAGIRTIAFCRTRSLVEWVYERTLSILQSNPETMALTSKVESYRGGYTAEVRRSIEERLFHRKLIGVVGTNALELGVDVGGVALTLHTGYPGSISALLQQSGRSGREKTGLNEPSCAVVVSFNSPSEQYIWKNPKCLLSRGVDAPPTLPINSTVLQGHLLCAGEEFPLTGDRPVNCLLNEINVDEKCPADCELFGSSYTDDVDYLAKNGLLSCQKVSVVSSHQENGRPSGESISVFSTHPAVKNPWKRVSLRSIEPVSYLIVDLSHNLQGGKTDKLHDQAAILDTIPYSRVFYHAFPGAIIMHRGRKYRIQSMENPPPFLGVASFGPRGCGNLLAFAKPTSLQYSTQPLNTNQITIVKQMEHAERRCRVAETDEEKQDDGANESCLVTSAVAGYGIVTVKRSVHGYKKLSHVNRMELSRTTISVPPMEFDTRALWIDANAACLRDVVVNFDGGVHALSHAMVAVAPLFVACAIADIDCDHSRYNTTQILLYDQRAGGSGVTAQLYSFILPALRAAVELLEECTSCYSSRDSYDGGCPACLQSVPCDNFHQDISRSAGIVVGKHLVKNLERSTLNSEHVESCAIKLRVDNDMQCPLKPNNIVIGRASWSPNNARTRWAEVDDVLIS